ncbi:hypothetical protein SERLADRAFT_365750 [Serpula lacrymans var. lacrymans S7.9]|uniref:UDENN domain-containing protein n=1 Tax=Serpula lacrymans var. lacrymans (strain S7.9) TaxID=578457 RepID=F8NI12_SERL9|nr:uncharacterized protein SERLADRAFT_365750 [Serpula lacrymans var. lacrymans S7.9]EGO29734.1 hypothetical protein SERLADRAFT_365750 [Serpula lacrymans var. lacrymans S7.9]
MTGKGQHCSFVLLAEFDIDSGAQLTYQFPQPLGTDEGLLANLMLPDGAERHLEDWTIFFLNQTPFNTIAPVLALETPEPNGDKQSRDGSQPELLYVLNLVRTKHDKSVRRGAVVKAMAICTRHPFIQIFKPVLLLALDDYFSHPSQDCLARLFDAINFMDIMAAPTLTRAEKLVMRATERKDIFAEKLAQYRPTMDAAANWSNGSRPKQQHKTDSSPSSHSSFEEGTIPRNREPIASSRARSGTHSSSKSIPHRSVTPPSDTSFSLGGSAVWVGDESVLDSQVGVAIGGDPGSIISGGSSTLASRGRKSTDASSSSSHAPPGRENNTHVGTIPTAYDSHLRSGISKDTHFYQTTIVYKGHQLPIKIPLSTFPEEVGDVSYILKPMTTHGVVSGPLHPHLHTNGSLTHPIIILFNALVTGKRVLFLGHNIPAGQVASYVLSACALGSGCGAILRGFIERAFPYAGLAGGEEWESTPAYIAGVTNPIFESSGSWDLLMDIGTGRVVVSKDILTSFPPTTTPPAIIPLVTRSGTIKAESSVGSEDDIARIATRDGKEAQKADYSAKGDSLDNIFIEDVISAITYHFGEKLVRMRFTEYIARFVRLAARYEEIALGSTQVSYTCTPFKDGHLGSGIFFPDEASGNKELVSNAARIEGWRRTQSYQYCVADFRKSQSTNAIQGFDLLHQMFRLRQAKSIADAEVELIVRTISENMRSYDQVVELLAYAPPHTGGLQPLSFCLFHQQESIRDTTVDILDMLRRYPVGVIFLQALNHFQRYAYVRQAHAREARIMKENTLLPPPPTFTSRTPSNRSESSLGGG